jgi:hypothetical protein
MAQEIQFVKDKFVALQNPDIDAISGNKGVRNAYWGGWTTNEEKFEQDDDNILVLNENRPAVKQIDISVLRTRDYEVITTIGMSCFSHVNNFPLRELMFVASRLSTNDMEEVRAFYHDVIEVMHKLARDYLDGSYLDFGHSIVFDDKSYRIEGKEFSEFALIRNPFADEYLRRFNLGELLVEGEKKVIDVEFMYLLPLYTEEIELYRSLTFNLAKDAENSLKELTARVLEGLAFDKKRESFAE